MSVVVRFAPSPTGYLHIGGARTAIFNYFFAKHHKGKFYLRIEDTDRERSTKEFENEIIESMKWLGLEYDGELVYQSDRMDVYKRYINKLLESGNAYYCNCSVQELEAERELAMKEKRKPLYNKKCRDTSVKEGVVRFRIPEHGEAVINDLVLGKIVIQYKEIEDFVIARADGFPTYNFTVVVDDAEMGMTHVIRGDDHVNNTPKQLLIFQALGLTPPQYAHVPMILGPDKTKLSKRHGATAVSQYRREGYLPEALVNYLIRLGWAHGNDEIFTKEDLINKFDLDGVGNSAAVLNLEKLDWLNAHYIKAMPPREMAQRLINEGMIKEELHKTMFSDHVQGILPMIQERSRRLQEVSEGLSFIIEPVIGYEPEPVRKYLKPEIKPIIMELAELIEKDMELLTKEEIENIFQQVITKWKVKLKDIAQTVRVLLTGKDVSPGIFDIMAFMDKEIIVKRLKAFDEIRSFYP